MVTLDCTVSREDGVTLVTGRIENGDRPRRVSVENQLAGPLWPPRCRGVPAAGWTATGFECVLTAGETRSLGYASPAPPVEPPLRVTTTEPVEPDADGQAFEPRAEVPAVESSPAGVVRTLDSPCPPRDAVPDPSVSDTVCDETSTATDADQSTCESQSGTADIEAWLAAVEKRLDCAADLSSTTPLSVAIPHIEAAGGVAGLRTLEDHLTADAERLQAFADRADTLAERARTTTVPVELVARLQ